MKSKFIFICVVVLTISCSSAKKANFVSDDYGYTEKNPIKVGGVSEGPAMERKYLNSLTGPKGEPVTYIRRGSCCQFDSKNSPFGMGMLDIYEVEVEGDTVKKILYLNMYDKDKLYAPKGFKMK